jgi:hypothetical protein
MKRIALSVLVLFAASAGHAFAGNFSQTCKNLTLQGSELKAECKKRDQSPNATSLKLDEKIGNLDGVLSFGDHNFSQTCSDIKLNGATLTAVCKRKNGTPNQTSLNLDKGIDNTDGVLKFDK